MRLASVAVLALLSSVALVGCGDDKAGDAGDTDKVTTTVEKSTTTEADEASSEDRDALISYFAGSDASLIDEEQGNCVADETLADLSEEGLATVRDGGDFDLAAFSDDDRGLLSAALDTCVELDDAVAAFATGITSEASLPLTDDEAQCAAEGFSSEYEGAGQFVEAVTDMSQDEAGATLFEALGPCITDETAVNIMATSLAGQGGLDEATGQCIAEQIVAQLGAQRMIETFAEAGLSGGASPELEAASEAAATACVGAQPGI